MSSKKTICLVCLLAIHGISLANQPRIPKDVSRYILKTVRMRNHPDAVKPEPKQTPAVTPPKVEKPEIKKSPQPSTLARPARPLPLRPVRRPVNVNVQFKQVVGIAELTSDTSFADAIEIIRHSTNPPLPIVVMWRDLEENAFVDKSTPIGIEGFSNAPVGQVLKLVLKSVSAVGGELEFIVEGGLITIATKSISNNDRRYTRVYDVGELFSAPSMGIMGGGFGGGGFGGGGFGGGGFGGGGFGGGGFGGSGFGNSGGGMSNNNSLFNRNRR